jgi:class 3 adenylate cyclase
VHILGWEWGAIQALLLASQRPDLVRSVTVLHGVATPERMGQIWGAPIAQVGEVVAAWILEGTAMPGLDLAEGAEVRDLYAPSRSADLAFQQWGVEAGRKGASPATAARMWRSCCRDGQTIDHAAITAPLLSLRRRDVLIPRELSQEVADLVPDGRLVEVPGVDLAPYAGDIDAVVAEIVGFATGETRAPVDTVHRLAAVLFTDIVGATDSLRRVGDDTWRGVLDVHDRIAERIVTRHGGRLVKSTGDGMLADFGLASQAVRAALGLRDELAAVGVTLRQGIHVGELVDRHGDISGMAVHVAARVMGAAKAGQVLATTAVQQAADRSTATFASCGAVDLKGIDGTWELFAVAAR